MEADDRRGQEIWSRALKMLARREHTERELRTKLPRDETDTGVVDEVVERLKRGNYLSDERFAEAFVRSRMERGDGPVKLRHALRERGVPDGLVDRFVDPADDAWEAVLRSVWARRFGKAPGDYKEWARQARFLQSRGFTAEQIRRVIPERDSA